MSNTPQIFDEKSMYSRQQRELEEKLKLLSHKRKDLIAQKQAVKELKSKQIRSSRQETSVEELKMLLNLSQEELESVRSSLSKERLLTASLEKRLNSLEESSLLLEQTNLSLSKSLVEKDSVLSQCMSVVLQLRAAAQKSGNAMSANQVILNIDQALSHLQRTDQILSTKKNSTPTTASVTTQHTSPELIECEDCLRLTQQIKETQELYKLTSEQLQERSERAKGQDESLNSLKAELKQAKTEFSKLSAQLQRLTSEAEYRARSQDLEMSELKKKSQEQDQEFHRQEARTTQKIEELEQELQKARSKILSLQTSKNSAESDLLQARSSLKALSADLQSKESKLEDLKKTNEVLEQEIDRLRTQAQLDREDFSEIKKLNTSVNSLKSTLSSMKSANGKLEAKTMSLREENAQLAQQLSNAQKELENATVSPQQVMQQLSFIILSKDQPETSNSKAKVLFTSVFGEQCTKLVETYDSTVKKLQEQVQRASEDTNINKHQLLDSLLEKKELLELLLTGYQARANPELERRLDTVQGEIQELENAIINQQKGKNLFSYRNSLDSIESGINYAQNELMRNESEKNKAELSKAQKECSELREKLFQAQKNLNVGDALAFLQCEAAALEDILQDSEQTIDDEVLDSPL